MAAHRYDPADCVRALRLLEEHGGNVTKAAFAAAIPRSTLNDRVKWGKAIGLSAKTIIEEPVPEPTVERLVLPKPPSPPPRPQNYSTPTSSAPRRHFIIPDTQVRPDVPTDHLDWIAKAIVDYKPDVIVHLGDHWDFPSLNSHEEFGSLPLEGRRYQDDLRAGNEAFARLCAPLEAEMKKNKKWKPERIFITGNHDIRPDRVAANNPKLFGTIGSDQQDVRGWQRYGFLDVVNVDGILYSHYFQSSHSARPIGGTIGNKLSRIGSSFAHGHVQGLDMGTKMMGNGTTLWGIAAGSCYLHIEDYRGAQGQRHYRGGLVLNEVENGECCPMPISLRYLCRRYTGKDLFTYMVEKYPHQNWLHLR